MKKLLTILPILLSSYCIAQSLGIGTTSPSASAQLDVTSITKGMLVPRMTMAQRDAIPSPATGLLIYQTDNTPGFYYYAGALWIGLSPGGDFLLPFNGNSSNPSDLFVVSNNSNVNPFNVIKGINNRNGGIALFGLNNATNGTGGYFNAATGPSLVTGTGNVGMGFTWAGNTDLGINKAKLMIRGAVGNSLATFGDNLSGIAIEGAPAAIGFNSYKNSLRTLFTNGFAGALQFDATTGRLLYLNTSTSGTAGATVTEIERMTILFNGNMGVGTVSPQRKMHVAGGLRVDTLASAAAGVVQSNTNGDVSKIPFSGTNTDVLRGDGTFGPPIGAGSNYWTLNGTHIYKNNSGNVGIGVIVPTYPLTVAVNNIGISQESLDGTTKVGFYTASGAAYIQTHTNHPLNFSTNNGVSQMLLTTSGDLGIGTSTPNYKLDVNGRMRMGHNGESSGTWFDKSDNTEGAFIGMANDSTIGFWGNGTVGSFKMGFDVKNGQVGIGVMDPTAPLSFATSTGNKISLWGASANHYGIGIQGSLMQFYTDLSTSDIAFGFGNSSTFTERMRIRGNGNVGIGINNPAYPLTISSSGAGIVQKNGAVEWGTSYHGSAAYIQTYSNHALHFTTNNGATQIMLNTDGNVGIGTGAVAPTSRLQVDAGSNTAIKAVSTSTAIEIAGAIKVSGSNKPAFRLTITASNAVFMPNAVDVSAVRIDNSLCDGDPNALIYVVPISAAPKAIGVWYNTGDNKWYIHAKAADGYSLTYTNVNATKCTSDFQNNSECVNASFISGSGSLTYVHLREDDQFNVMIIKQ